MIRRFFVNSKERKMNIILYQIESIHVFTLTCSSLIENEQQMVTYIILSCYNSSSN